MIQPVWRASLCLALLGTYGLLAGCVGQKQNVPLPAPAAKVSANHFYGTPVSGPVPEDTAAAITAPTTQNVSDSADASSTQAVVARFYVLEKMPLQALEPVGGYAQFITASRGGMPVLPTTKLTIGGRFAILQTPDDLWKKLSSYPFGRQTLVATVPGVLRSGQTVSFMIEDPESILDTLAGKPVHRKVTVQLYRPTQQKNGTLSLAIVLEDIADTPVRSRPVSDNSEDPGAPPTTQPTSIRTQRELALLSLPPMKGDEQCVAVLLPFRFAGYASEGLAAVLQLGTLAEGVDDLVAKADADVAAASEAVKKVTTRPVDTDSGLVQGLRSLANSETRRASLIFLASQTQAQLSADFALAADADVLEQYSAVVAKRISAENPPSDLGWQLDRIAFEMLAQAGSKRRMRSELRAVLTSFAGEAGRHASSLEELSQNLTSREELMNRLVAENLIYLEDNTPAARIRAYDWLAVHDKAPEGYDPLGRRKDREAALEKASTTGGQP